MNILLAEISAYDPPILFGEVCASLGFILWASNQWGEIQDRKKSPRPHPANEVLGASASDTIRRVGHLEDSNSKSWAKMESDRVESIKRDGELAALISGLQSAVNNCVNTANLLAIEVRNRRNE